MCAPLHTVVESFTQSKRPSVDQYGDRVCFFLRSIERRGSLAERNCHKCYYNEIGDDSSPRAILSKALKYKS